MLKEALYALMPKGGWCCGETYDSIEILEDGVAFGYSLPSEDQVLAEIERQEKLLPILAEIEKLEAMLTPRAIREAKRNNSSIKGYWQGELYCADVEAELERLELEELGR